MSDLLAARLQMAMSLGFHIVFAMAGIAMPFFMAIAEWRWLRRRDPVDLELAKRWARGTAILFAVGAVSGTVLSFELGLLWPDFMAYAGPIFGMPFSLEGFAFFLEAIFLGVYLYGWDRVPPFIHWLSGVIVAASGVLSGVFVVIANAWMNTPTGFRDAGGKPLAVDPFAAMANPAAVTETLHMTLAAYATIGFAVAGIHAFRLLRDRTNAFDRRAFAIALGTGAVAALLQPISGDLSGKQIAKHQPAKLAAAEGQFHTERGAPMRIMGRPDMARREMRGALEIPGMLSFMAHLDPNAEVMGLDRVPREDWPPVEIVHLAFDVMVGCGMILALVALLGAILRARHRRLADHPWYLRLVVGCAPLGFVAVEAGWTVTEVGRQPWIIAGVMRTADGLTPMRGLVVPLVTFTVVYLFLAIVVAVPLRRQVFHAPTVFDARPTQAARGVSTGSSK